MGEIELDYEIEVIYRLWILAFERKEWFRNARGTRMMLDQKRGELVEKYRMRYSA